MEFIIFGIAAVFLLIGFFLYDRINKFQYQNYRQIWDDAGGAKGFFWNAPESKYFSGWIQMNVRLLTWTFSTEDWMRNEPRIVRSALMMRFCFFSFWLLLIPFVYFGFAAKEN